MEKPRSALDKNSSRRMRFPDEESRFPWLSMLLDSYAIIDEGISVAVVKEETEKNISLHVKKAAITAAVHIKTSPFIPSNLWGFTGFLPRRWCRLFARHLKNSSQAIQKTTPVLFL